MATIRKTRGDDIDAACGQLAGRVIDRTTVAHGHQAHRHSVVQDAWQPRMTQRAGCWQHCRGPAVHGLRHHARRWPRRSTDQDAATRQHQARRGLHAAGPAGSAAKDKLERAEKQDPNNVEGALTRWRSCQERLNQPADAERHYQDGAAALAGQRRRHATPMRCSCADRRRSTRPCELFDAVIRNRLYRTPWAAADQCRRSACVRTSAMPMP